MRSVVEKLRVRLCAVLRSFAPAGTIGRTRDATTPASTRDNEVAVTASDALPTRGDAPAGGVGIMVPFDEHGDLGPIVFRSFFELPENVEVSLGTAIASPQGQIAIEVVRGPVYVRDRYSKTYEREGQNIRVATTIRTREVAADRNVLRLSVVVGRSRPEAFHIDRLLSMTPGFRADTRLLLGCLSENVQETFFANRIDDIIVGFFRDGERQIGTIAHVFTTTATADATSLFDMGQLDIAEKLFLTLRNNRRLAAAISFTLQADENTDWLQRFIYSYLAIELLCGAESLDDETKATRARVFKSALQHLEAAGLKDEVELVRPLRSRVTEASLRARFAIYARRIGLPSAEADIAKFNNLSRRRNELVHNGDVTISSDDALDAHGIALKYVKRELGLRGKVID